MGESFLCSDEPPRINQIRVVNPCLNKEREQSEGEENEAHGRGYVLTTG